MATVSVKVIPNSRTNLLKKTESGYRIKVQTPAEDGRANKAVIKLLAAHLGCKTHQISILSGEKSQVKRFEILD